MEPIMELVLSENQFNLVYNSFSFVIACMGAAFIFFLLSRSRVAPRHRMAVTLSTLVVGIALYHYVRIFDSFSAAFDFVDGEYIQTGAPFNEGYRYVDWLLTVPLLLAELVIVLKLAKDTTRSLLIRLTIAAVAMIGLGWPGELSEPGSTERMLWGIAPTFPFLYILYVLFVELGKSLGRQGPAVRKLVDALRYIILATWAVYPLAYIAPSVIDDEATAEVVRQVGYSVADVLAKPLFGLLVLAIALAKSRADGYGPLIEEEPVLVVPDDASQLASS
jgi:bacteriorhodopsin